MKPVVERADAAAEDLIEIWDYVAGGSEAAADAFLRSFDEKFAMLAASPRAGRERRELGDGVRSFPHGSYLIYYRIVPGGVRILRVRSGFRREAPVE